MTEQELSSVKVYELAKELGIPPLSLVERLKDLRIQVKNHMSDLSPQDVSAARTALGKKEAKPAGASAAGGAKKTVTRTRKKADDAEGAAPTAAAAAPRATEKTDTAAGAAKPSSVIRRRVKDDGATETLMPAQLAKAAEAAPEAPAEEMTFEPSTATFTPVAQEEIPAESPEMVETTMEAPAAPAQEPTTASAAPAQEPAAAAPAVPTIITPVKRAPVVLAPRPVAPRKSFLKIVEATALPQKPKVMPAPAPAGAKPAAGGGIRGQQTQDKDGFRIIRMTKENLDQMAEDEAAKKRGGGGGREQEIRPEDVRFADYRKKEMVFLPKKKRLPVGKQLKKTEITVAKATKRVVEMKEATISVQDFAAQLGVKAVEVIRKLMGMGVMATINQQIDFDTATLIAGEYQYEVKSVAFDETALLNETEAPDTDTNKTARPPIVTIMGHVDHGKTSLLDALRESNVAAGEAGGITQHIGAYTVTKDGHQITFIDTPGHEAFTVMRARGANVTDIVILVVAADDGVMPQTREALSHAKAAKVPIIVAVNKMDKPGANIEKVKQTLAELDLLSEDWGGQTMFVPVSALKKTGLDKLLESILLQAEILDLKSNAEARAEGTVLEARLDKGRGPVASLLISRGTLRSGDNVVASQFCGRVRAMVDHNGRSVREATPGTAVEILGLEGVPSAGDPFNATETEADARKIAAHRIDKARALVAGAAGKMSLENLFAKMKTGDAKELNVILKADAFGSVEAIKESLIKQSNEKVTVKVLTASPGGITETDVMLASASNAIIIGFNVRPETKARQVAEAEHVEIKSYSIIYELIDDIKNAMVGLLDKKKVEKFMGRAEVRQTFNVPKIGTIAGCGVIDGKITRASNVRLLRDSRIIFDGKISSLKRFKDDAKEVAQGFECGIGIEGYNDLKPSDVIEAYIIEMVTPDMNS